MTKKDFCTFIIIIISIGIYCEIKAEQQVTVELILKTLCTDRCFIHKYTLLFVTKATLL